MAGYDNSLYTQIRYNAAGHPVPVQSLLQLSSALQPNKTGPANARRSPKKREKERKKKRKEKINSPTPAPFLKKKNGCRASAPEDACGRVGVVGVDRAGGDICITPNQERRHNCRQQHQTVVPIAAGHLPLPNPATSTTIHQNEPTTYMHRYVGGASTSFRRLLHDEIQPLARINNRQPVDQRLEAGPTRLRPRPSRLTHASRQHLRA